MTEKGYGYQSTFHADMFFKTVPVGHEDEDKEYTDEEYVEKHFDTIREMKEKVTFVGRLTLT